MKFAQDTEVCCPYLLALLTVSFASLSLNLRACPSERFSHHPMHFSPFLCKCTGRRPRLRGMKFHHFGSSLRPKLYMPLPHSGLLILLCVLPAPQRANGVFCSPPSRRSALHMPDTEDFQTSVGEVCSGWGVGSVGTVPFSA